MDQPAKQPKSKFIKHAQRFSKTQLVTFVLVFAIIGGYFLIRSFAAAPLIASVEGENMIVQGASASATPTADHSVAVAKPAVIIVAAAVKPAIPTGLKAAAGNGSVTLSWNANPPSNNVNTYQVYYGTSASFSSFSVFINNIKGTSYTVTGLTNGKTYYFKVSAHNPVGYGPWSASPVGATPTAGTTTPPPTTPPTGAPTAKPAIPSGLTATAGNGTVTLNWSANAASDQVDYYQVYYGTDSSFSSFSVFTNNITATTYTVSGLTNGTTYYFKVSAHNSVGYGPWSAAPASATPSTGGTTTPPTAGVSQIVNDSSASNGKEVELLSNATLSGSFNLASSVTSLTVVAKATVCSGTGAAMVVSVDGSQVLSTTVNATSLTGYTANVNLAAGSHTLTAAYTNDSTTSSCDRNLYIDVTNFYGPNVVTTPAPTVSLAANPTSVTAGSSSMLSWSSANATNCTDSGAWSGSPTPNVSGSQSTGALNTSSTYTLTCTGAGGSATQSATVTVTQPTTGGGGSGAGSSGVTPPTAPSAYTVPSGATLVSTSAQLISALASGSKQNIVLANGTYDNSSAFSDANSDSIYAQNLGGATLTAGLTVGGNFGAGGAVIQGLAFNISATSKDASGGEINTWGVSGENIKVVDCTFQGNKVVPIGLYALTVDGLIAQRDQFYNFTDEGIRASDNSTVAYHAATAHMNTITDIYVNGVTYATPGGSNGTAEAGVWVGEPVDNGVNRIEVHNVSISGIETVNNSWDTTFSNLYIDMSGPNYSSGVGVYEEHFTLHDIFTNFDIVGTGDGFNSEWDDGTTGNAAGHFNTIENGTIDASGSSAKGHTVGIFLDQGTESTTVSNVTFKNQNWAGIGAYNNLGTNTFTNNTYDVQSGAFQTTTNHI